MTVEDMTDKMIEELKQQNVLLPGHVGIMRRYLIMAHGVGFNNGTKSRSNQKPILQFDKKGNHITEYESAAQAARITKIQHSDINKVCKGKAHTAGGFIWKYKD